MNSETAPRGVSQQRPGSLTKTLPVPAARDGVVGGREEREGGDHHGEGQGSRATGQVSGMLM